MIVNQPQRVTKRALVLSGGGGRGSYEVGVVKALFERGLDFELILGTSIGAINATLIAQGALDRLEEIWCTLRASDLFRLPSASQIGQFVLGHGLALLDNAPLERLLWREVDLDRLRSGRVTVGWITTDMCSLDTRVITIDEIQTKQELIDVLMATSALPFAFPPRHLNGGGLWVDGGLVRNTPMQAAIDRGVEEIYMVLLHAGHMHACPTNIFQLLSRCVDLLLDASARNAIQLAGEYNRMLEELSAPARQIRIFQFQPHKPVNATLLDIDPVRARQLIQQGYEEAVCQLEAVQWPDGCYEPG